MHVDDIDVAMLQEMGSYPNATIGEISVNVMERTSDDETTFEVEAPFFGAPLVDRLLESGRAQKFVRFTCPANGTQKSVSFDGESAIVSLRDDRFLNAVTAQAGIRMTEDANIELVVDSGTVYGELDGEVFDTGLDAELFGDETLHFVKHAIIADLGTTKGMSIEPAPLPTVPVAMISFVEEEGCEYPHVTGRLTSDGQIEACVWVGFREQMELMHMQHGDAVCQSMYGVNLIAEYIEKSLLEVGNLAELASSRAGRALNALAFESGELSLEELSPEDVCYVREHVDCLFGGATRKSIENLAA